MKKHIILLLLISTFLFLGCTETEGDLQNETNTTEITEDNSNTTLNFFYDPSWDLTIYDEFNAKLTEKLPGIKVDKKCIDLQKYIQNISSASEDLCVDEIGYLQYHENMELANEIAFTSSNYILEVDGQTMELPFTPVS